MQFPLLIEGIKIAGDDMGMQPRSWWQKRKPHRGAIGVLVVILVVIIALIIAGYWFDWTGFKGKTAWDWLGLLATLAIPVVVGFGVAWYTTRQNHDREIALEQHENELRIAADNQREAALQSYIDKMSELLLHENLRQAQRADEVRTIARVRTLTILPQLDPFRKRMVIRFLLESGLLGKDKPPVVDLSFANLRNADLHRFDLHEVDLHEVDLREADLREASLRGADLREARLNGANLTSSTLTEAHLEGADLSSTDILNGTNLSRAEVTDEQLAKAKSLRGAIMPDGNRHP